MAAKQLFGLARRWLVTRHRQGASTPPPGSSAAARPAAPGVGRGLFAVVVVLAACFAGGAAAAQTGGEAQEEADDHKASKRCVIVEIAGYRSGHLDCASQRLQDAARIARDQARRTIEVPQTGAPDVTIGVSSLSGTRLRMGNSLGHSVHPQRPGSTFAPPRLGGPQ